MRRVSQRQRSLSFYQSLPLFTQEWDIISSILEANPSTYRRLWDDLMLNAAGTAKRSTGARGMTAEHGSVGRCKDETATELSRSAVACGGFNRLAGVLPGRISGCSRLHYAAGKHEAHPAANVASHQRHDRRVCLCTRHRGRPTGRPAFCSASKPTSFG